MASANKPDKSFQTMTDRFSNRSPFSICEIHQEAIFNFCVNFECLKPICPECIEDHLAYHESNNTKPEFTSMKSVKSNCFKKIQAGITSLNQEVKKCELEYLLDPESLIEDGTKKIKKFRERLILIIDSHCATLEESLKRRVHENLLKISDFEGIFEKMKNILSELEYLKNGLEQNNSVHIIEKICRLDLKALMLKFRGEVHSVVETRDLEPIDIHVDENKFLQFKLELENMIYIQKDYKKSVLLENSNIAEKENNNSLINNKDKNRNNNNSIFTESNFVTKKGSELKFKDYDDIARTNNEIITKEDHESKKNIYDEIKQYNDIEPLNISLPNYFHPGIPNILHYFVSDENNLYKIDINNMIKQNTKAKFTCITINKSINIPKLHKSIITPTGLIFLFGGLIDKKTKSSYIYKLNEEEEKLNKVGTMEIGRSSFGLCIMGSYIYIVGGYANGSQLLKSCEKFNYINFDCEEIDDLNEPVSNMSLCTFNDNIFKFGGQEENTKKNKIISETIEIYNGKKWSVINFKQSDFQFHYASAMLQINKDQILIVGGFNKDNTGSNQVYIAEILSDNNKDGIIINNLNKKFKIPVESGFWSNQPIIYNKTIYFLQNTKKNAEDTYFELDRNILSFNGLEWKNLN